MDSVHSMQVKPLDADALEMLMKSVPVTDIVRELKTTTDKEKKAELKRKLPVAFFACQMPEDMKRPCIQNHNIKPSGLCMHDFDHLECDVRTFYNGHISGREAQLGVELGTITPSGDGLRLVTLLQDGETLVECQNRMARELGLEKYQDAAVKDLNRMSFIPSFDYLLYMNKEMFELQAPETTATKELTTASAGTQQAFSISEKANFSVAEAFMFEGIKYSLIIGELLNRIATAGKPKDGERNSDLYLAARELRHVTSYQFDMLYQLLKPYFSTLADNEVRRTINSAINSTGRTITPCMKGILAQLKQADRNNTPQQQFPKMPLLPPIMEMIASKFPKEIRPLVTLASLPIFGVYGTHMHFPYLDNRENALNFMAAVVGKSGFGKAFANHLYEMLIGMLANWDAIERKKEAEYQKQLDRRKADEEYPEDPCPKIRLVADDITTCMLTERIDNLKGEHALQFTEEIARLVNSRKSNYSSHDDLYCKSFDNGKAGRESKNAQTRNLIVQVFLNTLLCGTPDAMHRFYNNPEGGLNNRVIFCFLPNKRQRGVPRYENLNEEEQEQLNKTLLDLWHAGTVEGEEGQEITDELNLHRRKELFHFDFLDKEFTKYIDKCDDEYEQDHDETWRDTANRAAVVGYRAGVLAWQLWGRPTDKKTLGHVRKFAVWVADMMRIGVYNFSGEEYDRINEQNNHQPKVKLSKNDQFLKELPEEFSKEDMQEMRKMKGESTNVDMIVSRWMKDGKISKTPLSTYRKLPQIA